MNSEKSLVTNAANTLQSANAYVEGVLSGTIPACKTIVQAVQRHVDNLHRVAIGDASFPHNFDEEAAEKVLKFFNYLRHTKGTVKQFDLSPWQAFCIACLFGWKQADGTRRFRIAYLELPKKSGKSTLLAGLGLYLLLADGEAGAEVYSAATTRDQAKLIFSEASRMRDTSPALKKRIGKVQNNLHVLKTYSKFQALSSDKDSMDGINPSASLVDELHRHDDAAVWNLLRDSSGARRQPIQIGITTAGTGEVGFCRTQHNYSLNVLKGTVENDSMFVFIAMLDEGANWDDEAEWWKVNPNLNVTVTLNHLKEEAKLAKDVPIYLNDFKRYHLNIWTQNTVVFIPIEKYKACCDGGLTRDELIAKLLGRTCYAALDLAQTHDLSALVLLFTPTDDDPNYYVLPYFWCDEESLERRSKNDKVPYDVWANQGLLLTTGGNVTDFDKIRADILEIGKQFKIQEIAYDRWKASQLVTQLQGDGVSMVDYGQTFRDLSEPTNHLLKVILQGKLYHGNNPMLLWQAGNLAVEQNSEGFIKPSKNKSSERIDGMVSLVMAIGRFISNPSDSDSTYETKELIVI